MRRHAKACLAALAIVLVGTPAAFAQTTPGTGCTDQEKSNPTLQNSDKNNAGVICPPEVDPGMKAPTPKTGDTGAVVPPASIGNAPSTQPK